MEELIEAMKEDKYYPSATNEVENLKAKVSHNKQEIWNLWKRNFWIISNEIVLDIITKKVELFTICKTTRKFPKLLKSFQIQQNTTEFSRLNNYANKHSIQSLIVPIIIGIMLIDWFFRNGYFLLPKFYLFWSFKR